MAVRSVVWEKSKRRTTGKVERWMVTDEEDVGVVRHICGVA